MRLLRTKTLELEEFLTEDGLQYAILSHRWGKEEVVFADAPFSGATREKLGFAKIAKFCEVAASHGYEYAWVDTCCIDKTSSSELSEAINSMYRWYQLAGMCFVYLTDVEVAATETLAFEKEFLDSEWFRRGWTLQELIAPGPDAVMFFNRRWDLIGSKRHLVDKINKASHIHKDVLAGATDVHSFTIATRMSWASRRRTTRVEDMAYCLLGIFDVNMPLIYGEGEKALIRLQEQIMMSSDDRTIFTWSDQSFAMTGPLAKSPTWFRDYSEQWLSQKKFTSKLSGLYAMTNRGLSIQVRLYPWVRNCYVAFIAERDDLDVFRGMVEPAAFCVLLVKMDDGQNPACYIRMTTEQLSHVYENIHKLYTVEKGMVLNETINLLRHASMPATYARLYPNGKPVLNWFYVEQVADGKFIDVPIVNRRDPVTGELGVWDKKRRVLKSSRKHPGTVGTVWLTKNPRWLKTNTDRYDLRMQLGFDMHFSPVCVISDEAFSTKLVREAQRSEAKDVSRLPMEFITCLEDHGWSVIGSMSEQNFKLIPERRERPGFWAIKLREGCTDTSLTFDYRNKAWTLIMKLQEFPTYHAWSIQIGDKMLDPSTFWNEKTDPPSGTPSSAVMLDRISDLLMAHDDPYYIPGH